MILCTSITADYLEKSQPLFKSAAALFEGRRIVFCIGFTPEQQIDGWEIVTTPEPTQPTWHPSNRSNYYSLQHGAWLDYIDLPDTEQVLFVDSDTVLQKKYDLDFPATDALLVTPCSFPSQLLVEVVHNLQVKGNPQAFFDRYKAFAQREFCGCFLLASVATWRRLYKQCIEMYSLLSYFTHHAAWQLLINAAAYTAGIKVFSLPPFICNADWYKGTEAVTEDGLLEFAGDLVYFNHSKFNV